jgi:lysophospholipase L1-like esterase
MKLKPLLALLVLMAAGATHATVRKPLTTPVKADTTDAETRVNPVIDNEVSVATTPREYDFINYDSNHINLNGQSWEPLARKFASIADGGRVSIVHIGDSHIQAEGSTSVTRSKFAEAYGDGGRGLITPFKLAGTNQPVDYTVTSDTEFTGSRLLKTPWPVQPGFTGIGIKPASDVFTLTITSQTPFDGVRIFGSGSITILDVAGMPFTTQLIDSVPTVKFSSVSEATITLNTADAVLCGFELLSDKPGVEYSAFGNNGAAFSSYTDLGGIVGPAVSYLHPDLIIVSLGTNEAFGTISDVAFYDTIDKLMNELRAANPNAQFLLTTPSECQKSTIRTIRRGKRRRKVKSYAINKNVARLRDVIVEYGKDNGIPVYDWYEVAGGEGSSHKWLANKLLGRDRIHLSWPGYAVMGSMLYDAINDAVVKSGNQSCNN